MLQKILLRHIALLLIEKKASVAMSLSTILPHSYTIKHYIVIENIFVVIAFNLLVLHKFWKDMLMIVLKLMANR